jgi:hypothetical protein
MALSSIRIIEVFVEYIETLQCLTLHIVMAIEQALYTNLILLLLSCTLHQALIVMLVDTK